MTQTLPKSPAQTSPAPSSSREVVSPAGPCCCADWSAIGRRLKRPAQSRPPFATISAVSMPAGRWRLSSARRTIAGKYYYGDGPGGLQFPAPPDAASARRWTIIIGQLDRPAAESIYVGSVPVPDYLPGFAGGKRHAACSAPRAAHLAGACQRYLRPLRHGGQSGLRGGGHAPLHALCAGAGRQALSRPHRPYHGGPAGQPGGIGRRMTRDFPLFTDAREQALVAELEPGDALYLPKLWWHQVQSTGAFQRAGQLLVGRLRRRSRCAPHRHAAGHDRHRRAAAGRAPGLEGTVRSLCLSRSRAIPWRICPRPARHAGAAESRITAASAPA